MAIRHLGTETMQIPKIANARSSGDPEIKNKRSENGNAYRKKQSPHDAADHGCRVGGTKGASGPGLFSQGMAIQDGGRRPLPCPVHQTKRAGMVSDVVVTEPIPSKRAKAE